MKLNVLFHSCYENVLLWTTKMSHRITEYYSWVSLTVLHISCWRYISAFSAVILTRYRWLPFLIEPLFRVCLGLFYLLSLKINFFKIIWSWSREWRKLWKCYPRYYSAQYFLSFWKVLSFKRYIYNTHWNKYLASGNNPWVKNNQNKIYLVFSLSGNFIDFL